MNTELGFGNCGTENWTNTISPECNSSLCSKSQVTTWPVGPCPTSPVSLQHNFKWSLGDCASKHRLISSWKGPLRIELNPMGAWPLDTWTSVKWIPLSMRASFAYSHCKLRAQTQAGIPYLLPFAKCLPQTMMSLSSRWASQPTASLGVLCTSFQMRTLGIRLSFRVYWETVLHYTQVNTRKYLRKLQFWIWNGFSSSGSVSVTTHQVRSAWQVYFL